MEGLVILLSPSDIKSERIFTKEYRDYNERVDVPEATVYSEFFFRRSYFTNKSVRIYQKIDMLISYIGGFTGIFLPLFAVFLQFYNKHKCN